MGRLRIDCRAYPSVANCTMAMEADSEEELLRAAALHAVDVHGHEDGPELREGLKGTIEHVAEAA